MMYSLKNTVAITGADTNIQEETNLVWNKCSTPIQEEVCNIWYLSFVAVFQPYVQRCHSENIV